MRRRPRTAKIHVITGVYSGVVDDIEAFATDKAATKYEKKLKRRYGSRIVAGEDDVQHWILKVRKGRKAGVLE